MKCTSARFIKQETGLKYASNFGKCFIPLDCSNNMYGRNCALNCQCHVKHTLSCDPVFGKCRCKSGWRGDGCIEGNLLLAFIVQARKKLYCIVILKYTNIQIICDSECDDFLHGQDCTEECKCNRTNTAWCDAKTGKCHCNPGWQGPKCDKGRLILHHHS